MQQKTTAILFLVFLLGLGFLAGSFVGGFFGQLTVPTSHKSIVDSMTVTDTSANFKLTPKLLSSSNLECAKGLSVTFIKGKHYQQTVWSWERNGDVELVMCIWGPDENGHLYGIEISRLAWNPFEVKIDGVTKLTVDAVTSMPAVGYYSLEVTVD